MRIIVLLSLLTFVNALHSQVIDFESVTDKEPGEAIHFISLPDHPCELRFFIGHNLSDTTHLTLQKIGLTVKGSQGLTGGFQGIKNNKNCHEKVIPQTRMNQINYNPFVLNNEINNRERVGCHFVSTILRGDSLPSVFIHFSIPTQGCSADILDLDGADDAIEAYEIYYYESESDFPNRPINAAPIEIRTTGPAFGKGEIGEDGGVVPFKIESEIKFKLIEIRPNQQVSPENKFRNVFGFALDNFAPFTPEQSPFLPPYLTGNEVKISTVEPEKVAAPQFKSLYFDYDESDTKSRVDLDELANYLLKHPHEQILLVGYTDPKGDADYNLKLSQRRVISVKKALMKKGVLSDQIEIEYKGEINDNNQEDWTKRRVDIQRIN